MRGDHEKAHVEIQHSYFLYHPLRRAPEICTFGCRSIVHGAFGAHSSPLTCTSEEVESFAHGHPRNQWIGPNFEVADLGFIVELAQNIDKAL